MDRFIKNNKDWLDKPFIHPVSANENPQESFTENEPEIPSCSRYDNYSRMQQYRLRKNLQAQLEDEPVPKLLKVVSETVTASGEKLPQKSSKDLEFVMRECIETPTRPTKIASSLRAATAKSSPYTPEEALAIIVDRKLSVETYKFFYTDLKERGFPALPSYRKILQARKECYPTAPLFVSERVARTTLQSLLEHTFLRLVKIQDEPFNQFFERIAATEFKFVFHCSWGFDGSSGQALYKQTTSMCTEEEQCIFATSLIPLQIISVDGQMVWCNPTPQSYRYCRPLKIQYAKETKELVLAERQWVEEQISNLNDLVCATSKGYKLICATNLMLTVIDGKVFHILTETASQLRCPLCKATTSEFNDLDHILSKPINEEGLKHGLSPLHAWIRVLEFLLRLGYKIVVKKWRVIEKSVEGKKVAERRLLIQQKIRNELGLLVDVVKPNSGTTNDGNTARALLSDENRSKFAEILGLEVWLLDSLQTILTVISSGLEIDPEKFGTFCLNIAHKYVDTYSWFNMPVTIHKLLIHGKAIISKYAIPVGMLSEQAAEARNKFWRHDREHHARKTDRISTMTDLFHRALESSDPVISNFRLLHRWKKIKRIPLTTEAMQLLKPMEVHEHHEEDEMTENVEATGESLEQHVALLEEDSVFSNTD